MDHAVDGRYGLNARDEYSHTPLGRGLGGGGSAGHGHADDSGVEPPPQPLPAGEGLSVDIILPPLVPTRPRADGWTPQRQRDFLEALASCGSVGAAARSVGMSRESAYALRRRADARGFAQAWDAARLLAAEHLVDLAWDRAVQGELRPLVYHGEVVGEVRYHDNRLLLGLIAQNRKVLVEQGLVAPPEVTAAVAADWEAALTRAERGEVLEAQPLPAARGAGADPAARASLVEQAGGEWAADAAIPPPLPPVHDERGAELTEAQALEIGLYHYWWDEEQQCLLTNWPAPEDWAGRQFRIDPDNGEAEEIAPHPADEARDAGGAPWPGIEAWARTLDAAEEAGLAAAAEADAARRAARLALYYRAAFGLASAAERAAIAAAGGARWGGAPD